MTRMTDSEELAREQVESALAILSAMRLSLEIAALRVEQQIKFEGPSERLESLQREIADARRRRTAAHDKLGAFWQTKYERSPNEPLLK